MIFEISLRYPVLDLASSALGSSIVKVTDEFFAPAINMINPAPPIHAPGKFIGKKHKKKRKVECLSFILETGAWMDGWETKRHNPNYDW